VAVNEELPVKNPGELIEKGTLTVYALLLKYTDPFITRGRLLKSQTTEPEVFIN
jgi:hypothetical protein